MITSRNETPRDGKQNRHYTKVPDGFATFAPAQMDEFVTGFLKQFFNDPKFEEIVPMDE